MTPATIRKAGLVAALAGLPFLSTFAQDLHSLVADQPFDWTLAFFVLLGAVVYFGFALLYRSLRMRASAGWAAAFLMAGIGAFTMADEQEHLAHAAFMRLLPLLPTTPPTALGPKVVVLHRWGARSSTTLFVHAPLATLPDGAITWRETAGLGLDIDSSYGLRAQGLGLGGYLIRAGFSGPSHDHEAN